MVAEIALCALMIASMVVLISFGSAELLTIPPLIVAIFFAIPLCRTFLQGVDSGREAIAREGGVPMVVFRRAFWPRVCVWLALWATYFLALEVYMGHVLGGSSLMTSASCVGLVLAMVASCFVWAPRCSSLWSLAFLTLLTSLPTVLLFCLLGGAIINALGLGGYMGLGAFVFAPLAASGLLLPVTICVWLIARRQGAEWFRV